QIVQNFFYHHRVLTLVFVRSQQGFSGLSVQHRISTAAGRAGQRIGAHSQALSGYQQLGCTAHQVTDQTTTGGQRHDKGRNGRISRKPGGQIGRIQSFVCVYSKTTGEHNLVELLRTTRWRTHELERTGHHIAVASCVRLCSYRPWLLIGRRQRDYRQQSCRRKREWLHQIIFLLQVEWQRTKQQSRTVRIFRKKIAHTLTQRSRCSGGQNCSNAPCRQRTAGRAQQKCALWF